MVLGIVLNRWTLMVVAAGFFLAGPGALKQVAWAESVKHLVAGETVEASIRVGEVQSYQLQVGKGRSVSFRITKNGVALVGLVQGPDGDTVQTFGSISKRQGEETVSFVANTDGSYRIEVRTNFPPSAPGTYSLELAAVHAASIEEKSRLALKGCQEKRWRDAGGNFLVDEALAGIAACLDAVGRKLADEAPRVEAIVAGARAEIDYLTGRWHWGEFVSPAYEENLTEQFRVLAGAAGETEVARALRMLDDVAADLAVKAEHCRNSPRGLGEDLQVQVTTLEKSREAKGWWVYYKLKIHRFTDRFDHRFPLPSSPTSETLPAGNYWVWASQSGSAEGQNEPKAMQELHVLGKDRKPLEFSLEVP